MHLTASLSLALTIYQKWFVLSVFSFLFTGGVGKSWSETLEELSRDIAHRLPAQFDIERALIQFPVR